MTKARPALASVPLLTARGLLSLILGSCPFAQNARPDTPNPSLFQLQHTAWTERDGAPPTINDISQAPDGSLWLGSGEGLYRFDGFTFERVRAIDGDSPAPTEVYCLLASSNGDLWIGTSFNGAILLRNGVAKRYPKFEGIPLNTTVWSLVEDLDGTIWAGTASGLQHFDGSQWRSVGKDWGVPEMVESRLQIDSSGTLWAETSQPGHFRLKRGLRHFERLAHLPHEDLFFDQSPSGEYWANTSSGVCPLSEVLNGTAGPHCVVHDNWNVISPFSALPIHTFDRRGNLWTRSARSGGIRRLDAAAFRDAFHPGHPEGKVESFTKRDGLTSDEIQATFRDRRDGSIWVGTDHGLDHFREPSFLPAFPKPGVASFGIQAQKDGRVWIGSIDRGGLWIASPEGRTERITLPGFSIQSLYETQRGTLWFATYSPMTIGSINDPPSDRPKGGKIARLPLTPELQSQVAVQSIVEDRGGASEERRSLAQRLGRRKAVNLLPGRASDARQVLEAAVDDAAQAVSEARDAVQDMRSSATTENDLAKAVEAMGQELAAHYRDASRDATAFSLEVEGAAQDLHPILRDEIYRIASEALRNAFHHSQARGIEVEIRYDPRQLRVRVRDDGIGIHADVLRQEGREGHFGFRGMRERAKGIGGKLEIWSEQGAGTEVELIVPTSVTNAGQARCRSSLFRSRLFRSKVGTNS